MPDTVMPTDKARIVSYIPPDMKEDLERLAEIRYRSVSNLVEALIGEEIARAKTSGELPTDQTDRGGAS